MKKKQQKQIPELAQLEAELARVKYRSRYRLVLRSTVYTLIVVAAIAVLVATIWMPVLQIYGSSMTPTLSEGFWSSAVSPAPASGWILTMRAMCTWMESSWTSHT